MSVTDIDSWKTPGCGPLCRPRSHDPIPHENHGRLLERADAAARRDARIVRTGALRVDLDTQTVTVGGIETHLPPRQWQLLAYLAERLGQWCPTGELQRAIRGEGYEQPGAYDALVRANRYRLRDRLGVARALVECRWNGYMRLVRQEPTP